MNLDRDETKAILSKALILADKTAEVLEQFDHRDFPTPETGKVREILLHVFNAIKLPSNYKPMEPSVLYNKILALQEMVELLGRSSIEHVPWPFVGYCDQVWAKFFGNDESRVFYSVALGHNYSIERFSQRLRNLLQGVLPRTTIDALVPDPEFYCLELASVEDENLPLYANVGHEFGHALFDRHDRDLFDLLNRHVISVLTDIEKSLYADTPIEVKRRLSLAQVVIAQLAKEVFCDVIAALLMGPAFFLSFYEMSWGQKPDLLHVTLSPRSSDIKAHPSFLFRLHVIREHAGIERFCLNAKTPFSSLRRQSLRSFPDALNGFSISHANDSVHVRPDTDADAAALRNALDGSLPKLKTALEAYARDCTTLIEGWYPGIRSELAADDVAQLLLRLEYEVLPNVIPDGTLLGRPVDFKSILNAAALFRMEMLCDGENTSDSLARQAAKIERLTAKALEVSFVQRRFGEWREGCHERPQ